MATTVTPYSSLSALIIDDMAVQQSTLRGHLALLGISKVEAVSTPDDALRNLRSKKYNLVLCDYNLNAKTDGQQLFEYARDNQMLPPDTLFFMITAESSYASVAAATEQHPDAYLLKPITASDIEERLKAMLDKRDALLVINTKITKDDLAGALAACDALLAQKSRWTMSVLQNQGQPAAEAGPARRSQGHLPQCAGRAQRPHLGASGAGTCAQGGRAIPRSTTTGPRHHRLPRW